MVKSAFKHVRHWVFDLVARTVASQDDWQKSKRRYQRRHEDRSETFLRLDSDHTLAPLPGVHREVAGVGSQVEERHVRAAVAALLGKGEEANGRGLKAAIFEVSRWLGE